MLLKNRVYQHGGSSVGRRSCAEQSGGLDNLKAAAGRMGVSKGLLYDGFFFAVVRHNIKFYIR